jgi:hypothetical protein
MASSSRTIRPNPVGSYSGAWVLKDAIFSVSRGKRCRKIDARYAN